MTETYRSNWNSVLLFLGGAALLLLYGYDKYGFSRNIVIGAFGELGCALWLAWERYTTYLEIADNRWLVNAEQRLYPDIKIDIASILYIARAPHFVFRSWGGRMVIFYKHDRTTIRQTGIPETFYTWDSLASIIKKLMAIKSTIELDPQYQLLVSKIDPADAELSQQSPRSMKEIETYVIDKYGAP